MGFLREQTDRSSEPERFSWRAIDYGQTSCNGRESAIRDAARNKIASAARSLGLLSSCLLAGLLIVIGLVSIASAQAPSPQPPDPLLSLLMSQPRIALNAPVVAESGWDPPAVRPGQAAVYRLTLNALEDSIELPDPMPSPSGVAMRPGAHGQILQMAGTNMEARTTFVFHVRPTAIGPCTVPSYTVQVYGRSIPVPATTLQVMPNASSRPAQRLYIDLAGTNFYAGQAIRPRILLPMTYNNIQTLSQVQLIGQGFLVDQSAVRQRIEPIVRNGSNIVTYVYEPLLTPISSGKLSMTAQGWSIVNRTTSLVSVSNNTVLSMQLEQALMDSDSCEFTVRPLPKTGQLPGFTGAVGRFTNDPPKLAANTIAVGEVLKMRVTIRGDGNVARLVPPPAPPSQDWQIFEASGDSTVPQVLHSQGAITFTYTLIPLTADVRATPALPFSVFDPYLGRYVDLTIPSVPVNVGTGAAPVERDVLAQAAAAKPPAEVELTLSGLAASPGATLGSLVPVQQRSWFPLVQLAPGLAFAALWAWDRRRQYLRRHPEVVLRRKARRQLRRHRRKLRRASEAADGLRYAATAVSAMRIASAPHYPAEPRALVGADVLELLPLEQRIGKSGQIVRRLFAFTDAMAFGEERGNPSEVLKLAPEFDKLLDHLEQQLAENNGSRIAAGTLAGILMLVAGFGQIPQARAGDSFQQGTNAFAAEDYAQAAAAFAQAADAQPASGTYQNLGLAEWQRGETGLAVLAWERALWIDPFNRGARQNLAFARKQAQLDSPELTWYEVISTWLPANSWAWIAGTSLWLAVAVVLLPGIFGKRKAGWHQSVAAFALMLFLLSLPAHMGVYTRTRLGFVLQKDTVLRLTPTRDAQVVTRLAGGEPARWQRSRGQYLLVRASRFSGWIERSELGLTCSNSGKEIFMTK